MAGAGTKRIVDLTETSEVQSGDYLAIDSTARGTKKTPVSVFATAADLTAEQTARAAADTTLDGKITAEAQARANAISAEQTAREEADDALTESVTALSDEVTAQGELIQNPTKTVSGAIAHFTDGAEMPAQSVIVNITPKQSGSGTPSPYNVRQISGWESVVLTVEGKNVFSGTTKNNKNLNGSGNEETDYSRSCTTAINVDAGKAYTISYTENVDCGVFYYDKNNIFLSLQGWAANPRTFTPPENTAFVRFAFKQGTAPTNIQVEVGNTATTYEPYTGTTTTTALGRTVYGGTLDVVSGLLTVTKEIIDLGSLTWQYNGSYGAGGAFYSTDKNFGYTDDREAPNMVCSIYPVKSRNDLYSSADPAFGVTGNAQTRYATVRDTRYTDPTAFKTAMNGVQLVYPVATPQTYTLTPTEVSTLLGENNVWADAGGVEITYRRDINLALEQLEALLNS